MSEDCLNSLGSCRSFDVLGQSFEYFDITAASQFGDTERLPITLKVLLENLIRNENGRNVNLEDIKALASWTETRTSSHEISFKPARVLMQDFTGVPAVVDLASMRDAMVRMGGDPSLINPLSPVDLVIDHSVMIDSSGSSRAFEENVKHEFDRNKERYEFLKWGQMAFNNFRVVPPGTGICHQVNLEYLAKVVWEVEKNNKKLAYPDTVVGTDSHTTMVNGLAVLGWGVGGIEAEAVMLGQPISMLIPEVIGFRLTGKLKEGITATDLVLNIVEMLRKKGVVGKFVEFYGNGCDQLTLADQATIANMAPEYGATCGFFPISKATLEYMTFTGREKTQVALVETYAKAQGMWRDENTVEPLFTDVLELDLSSVEPSISGPKRPQDRILLKSAAQTFKDQFTEISGRPQGRSQPVKDANYDIKDGAIVIAAITSCTNTSNPAVLIAAGLLAKKAHMKGLRPKPWVKTSFAPGSQVVQDYMEEGGLLDFLNALNFNLVAFGCTTCIGNSGPLEKNLEEAITEGDIAVTAVLSGNRNFEGRVHPLSKANYLASPPLVVAYSLIGNMNCDIGKDPLGHGTDNLPIFLKDIWPSTEEIQSYMQSVLKPEMFRTRYSNILESNGLWNNIAVSGGNTYDWQPGSTYIQHSPFFEKNDFSNNNAENIVGARPLAILGASITTDHISPAGSISNDGPAGKYLLQHQVRPHQFNSYGSRRGNYEVMMRGTFANIRIRNQMAPGTEGGVTTHHPSGAIMSIYEASIKYQEEGVPLVIIGGIEYGSGSSRDWAAKGTRLLGVRAVIVESFERIHRSNLVGMGVLPLTFKDGVNSKTLEICGTETFDILGLEEGITPRMELSLKINRRDGTTSTTAILCRIDTLEEVDYFMAGGILQYVLKNLKHAA